MAPVLLVICSWKTLGEVEMSLSLPLSMSD